MRPLLCRRRARRGSYGSLSVIHSRDPNYGNGDDRTVSIVGADDRDGTPSGSQRKLCCSPAMGDAQLRSDADIRCEPCNSGSTWSPKHRGRCGTADLDTRGLRFGRSSIDYQLAPAVFAERPLTELGCEDLLSRTIVGAYSLRNTVGHDLIAARVQVKLVHIDQILYVIERVAKK